MEGRSFEAVQMTELPIPRPDSRSALVAGQRVRGTAAAPWAWIWRTIPS